MRLIAWLYIALASLLMLLGACSQDSKHKETSAVRQSPGATSSAPANKDGQVSTDWAPEPVAIGIALKKDVLVYADSSREATILDTLNLAEDILSFASQRYEQPILKRKNWLQVETRRNQRGWVQREELIIVTQFLIETNGDDSVCTMPGLRSTYLGVYGPNEREIIDERVINDGRVWLSLRPLGSTWASAKEWILIKKLRFDLRNVYLRILMDFVGFSLGGYSFDDVSIIHKNESYDVILEIARRVESEIAQGKPMLEVLDNDDNGVSVSTAVLPTYARSEVYRRQGDFAKRLIEMEKMMTRYADQKLFFGRAAPETALDLAEQYLSMGDTAKAVAQFHFVIANYPGEPREGFEWNYYTDLEAIKRIADILKKRPQQLLEESDKIISEAKFPAVRLRAYVVKIQNLGAQNLFDAMIDTALAGIQRDPDVALVFYQSTVDFASYVAAAAFDVLEQKDDSTRFSQLAQTLQTRFPHHLVSAVATLKLARFVEGRHSDPELVRRLYKRIIDDFNEFVILDPITRREYGTYMAKHHLGIAPE